MAPSDTEPSMSLIAANPLAGRLRELRDGDDLLEHIGAICRRLEQTEEVLQALLPEENRRDRLLREAAELQSRFPAAEDSRSHLFGVLVGVKDIFHVAGFATRAGTALPWEQFASVEEAACVTSLKNAGALVLGKTVTTEFAYFEPGPTRNPHDPAHTPGGSSSGSAAAVAAGYCPLALGTQTVGSVIRPAAFCGIVGFKPSYGRIDSAGLIFCAPSVDTVGLFTQDARGMQLAAAAVCRDWAETAVASGRPTLGVPAGPYLEQASVEGKRHFEKQVTQLEGAGYSVRRVSLMADIDEINGRHRLLQAGEMALVHREWFASYEQLYRKRTAEIIREGLAVEAADLEWARAGRIELRKAIDGAMSGSEVDVWICPSATGPAPRGLESTGDPVMNLPWTHAGLPALSLPGGTADDGLPLGVQCVAGYGRDEALLEWGLEMEEVLRG